jgi:hypothetical protein
MVPEAECPKGDGGTTTSSGSVEEEKVVEDGHGRRRREDYEELDRLLEEANQSLGDEDLRGANEVLKRAGVKAASMWGEVGRPTLPGHTRKLITLVGEFQRDLGDPEQDSLDELRDDIGELRSRFEREAREDAR